MLAIVCYNILVHKNKTQCYIKFLSNGTMIPSDILFYRNKMINNIKDGTNEEYLEYLYPL